MVAITETLAMGLLNSNVNQDVLDRVGQLAGEFSAAQPFRHVLIDGFFTAEFCRQLADNFPAFDETLAVNTTRTILVAEPMKTGMDRDWTPT